MQANMIPFNSVLEQMQTSTLPLGTALLCPPDGLAYTPVRSVPRTRPPTWICQTDDKTIESSTNCKESDPSDPIKCTPANDFVFWLGQKNDYSDEKVTSSLIKKHYDIEHPESGRNAIEIFFIFSLTD